MCSERFSYGFQWILGWFSHARLEGRRQSKQGLASISSSKGWLGAAFLQRGGGDSFALNNLPAGCPRSARGRTRQDERAPWRKRNAVVKRSCD